MVFKLNEHQGLIYSEGLELFIHSSYLLKKRGPQTKTHTLSISYIRSLHEHWTRAPHGRHLDHLDPQQEDLQMDSRKKGGGGRNRRGYLGVLI